LKIVSCPVGAVGCDMLTPLTAYTALALANYTLPGTQTKITFVVRYLENLTVQEIVTLHAADLGVQLVGESRAPGWMPTAALGSADGLRVVTKARGLAIPSGAEIWCDLETPIVSATHADIALYSKAHCDVVNASYDDGGYVGSGLPSTPLELYLLPFHGYWHSLSNVQPVANVDYKQIQLFPSITLLLPTGPLAVDLNVSQQDKRGRLPTMLVRD
jgi:hypothetical protein